MASKRNSFLLRPSSYTREFNSLSLPELGLMFKAIYAHAGAEHAAMPELSPLLRMALSPIFNEMDKAAAEYEAVCQKRAQGGKLGGRPITKRPEIEPQGVENNLKVAQGCSRGHEQPRATSRYDDNPFGYDDQPPPDYDPTEEPSYSASICINTSDPIAAAGR